MRDARQDWSGDLRVRDLQVDEGLLGCCLLLRVMAGAVPVHAKATAVSAASRSMAKPASATLPWAKPDGDPKTFRLLFVDAKGRAYNRSVFNMGDRKRALAAADAIPPRERGARYLQAAPEDGMHALRHACASVLLDGGESIKVLSEHLAPLRH
ncbi:hypothetical protein M878_18115 [Streptomyces roseochromogenus subsp. oscitans DS 12.976]|uniref:Tyr recombinase domain-containing protein n=1 Tax=Streptomyces roseochromogenus subsp. oscitans DS 12.976 TaxID=1352936 RepID=V6KF07_STRRC|nr:hypothetical protein M878_18115 [Streptomyces roseochromogenus subsp. oscitans DS 12.976]